MSEGQVILLLSSLTIIDDYCPYRFLVLNGPVVKVLDSQSKGPSVQND